MTLKTKKLKEASQACDRALKAYHRAHRAYEKAKEKAEDVSGGRNYINSLIRIDDRWYDYKRALSRYTEALKENNLHITTNTSWW